MPSLSARILAICGWAQRDPRVIDLPAGGRPDLAGSALRRVMIPTLFIVATADEPARHLSLHAIDRMHNDAHLEIVTNASGRFEEPELGIWNLEFRIRTSMRCSIAG